MHHFACIAHIAHNTNHTSRCSNFYIEGIIVVWNNPNARPSSLVVPAVPKLTLGEYDHRRSRS